MTNAHVVENYTEFRVDTTFTYQEIFEPPANGGYTATVLAVGDPENVDIAVLKVDTPMMGIAVLEFGDSKELENGDIVFGIGHPTVFGSWVITAGEFIAPEYILPPTMYIDKPGGSGESGSPLFNMEGKVVGIIFGGTTLEDRPLITPEDNIVVWWGNAPKYRNEVTMVHDTDSIYNFLVQELGEGLANEIFR